MSVAAAFTSFETAAQETAQWFAGEVAALRSGRVTPGTINDIQVEHYGARTPLAGVGTITALDARTLQITPWDASAIPAISTALSDAQLGASPVVDGKVVRLSFPLMSEEVREETIKKLHKKAEDARIRLRQARDEALSIITHDRKEGVVTEDEFYASKKGLNERIDMANGEIEKIVKTKEAEIRKV